MCFDSLYEIPDYFLHSFSANDLASLIISSI